MLKYSFIGVPAADHKLISSSKDFGRFANQSQTTLQLYSFCKCNSALNGEQGLEIVGNSLKISIGGFFLTVIFKINLFCFSINDVVNGGWDMYDTYTGRLICISIMASEVHFSYTGIRGTFLFPVLSLSPLPPHLHSIQHICYMQYITCTYTIYHIAYSIYPF